MAVMTLVSDEVDEGRARSVFDLGFRDFTLHSRNILARRDSCALEIGVAFAC